MINAEPIADALTERFGVHLQGEAFDDQDGQHVRLTPGELPRTQGFSIELLFAWRSLEAYFSPAPYARRLIGSMETADPSQRATFSAFMRAARDDGFSLRMEVNGKEVDAVASDEWPSGWQSLSISMRKGQVMLPDDDPDAIRPTAISTGGRMLGAVLSLLPLEPVDEALAGETEGARKEVMATRYERSPVNRAACIELHGTLCGICGIDFGTVYGELGEGFIEVHHIVPVSTIELGTVVDPATDLIPVCSNCHSMVHRKNPPLTPGELRRILSGSTT